MKINIIMPGLGKSGGQIVLKRYADELSELGNDVVIYCPIIAYNLHRYKNPLTNIIHKLYCTSKNIIQLKKDNNSLKKWVLSINNKYIRDADVTIATMWATAYDVAKLSKNKGKKYYFIQGFEIWDSKKWGLNSYRLPLNKIVISTWINEQLRKELNIGPFPVVMNGIDTNLYRDLHIRNDDTKIFLMLNHTLEIKGVEYGLQVFEKVKSKYHDAKLIMFGMCNRENIPDNIEYYQNPSSDQLLNLYNKANFFIFPSLEEGWGLTPIEAMACGAVVFGTRTGFVMDIGKNKINMMISNPKDIEAMVDNIENLIENHDLYLKIKNKGMDCAHSLSWSSGASQLLRYLSEDSNEINKD